MEVTITGVTLRATEDPSKTNEGRVVQLQTPELMAQTMLTAERATMVGLQMLPTAVQPAVEKLLRAAGHWSDDAPAAQGGIHLPGPGEVSAINNGGKK